jgi:hypothetical protein
MVGELAKEALALASEAQLEKCISALPAVVRYKINFASKFSLVKGRRYVIPRIGQDEIRFPQVFLACH